MTKRYTVTSALPYANGPLHIGHIAGAYLPADIYVRYRKSKQDDVLFVCGSDEHGAAITLKQKKKDLALKKLLILIISSINNRLLTLALTSIFITVPQTYYIIKLLKNSLGFCTKKGCLRKAYPNNSLMKSISSF